MTISKKALKTGFAAVALMGAVSVVPAQADSYINQVNPLDKQATAVNKVKKADRKRVHVRPASSRKTQNFGVYVRDTRGEGYGPNGR